MSKRFMQKSNGVYTSIFDDGNVIANISEVSPNAGDSLCKSLNELHEQAEAAEDVIEAADDFMDDWNRDVPMSQAKANVLTSALKKLKPPTPEELLTARLDAADALLDAADFESGYDSRIAEAAAEKYKAAKEAHESQ